MSEKQGGNAVNKRSFRDFHYDHSDILLAVIIILIAAILIVWRINVIIDYPKTLDAQQNVTQTTEQATNTGNVSTSGSDSSSAKDKATWADNKLAADLKITIKKGDKDDMIQTLVTAGLFTSPVDYQNMCGKVNVKPNDIKAGTYTFRKNMTKTTIVKLVTSK